MRGPAWGPRGRWYGRFWANAGPIPDEQVAMSGQRPTGVIAWIRRRPLSWAAKLSALAGLAAVGVWGLGRVLNDDHAWSQFLFWIPTVLVVALAWVMVVVSAICSRLSLRMGGVMLRPFLALVCIGLTGWLLIGEWGVHRYAVGPEAREDDVRVLHWNISVARQARGAPGQALGPQPDIAIIANIRNDEYRQPLLDALATLLPPGEGEGGAEDAGEGGGGTPDLHFIRSGALVVVSRFPIRRWGAARLEPVESKLDDWRSGWDPGRVFFIEIDAGLGAGPLTVWALDLPSDPTMSRAQVMREAAAATGAWDGPEFFPGREGEWVAVLRDDEVSFPEPDLVVGDFNIPRGSRSLRTLVGGMTNAFEVAGRGPAGSWPRKAPLWHIDQAFVGDRVEATRYRLEDPGLGEHRMQVIDLRAGE